MQAIAQQLRAGVLAHMRVPAGAVAGSVPQAVGGGLSLLGLRGFADGGVDKAAVTERVINVVKNFEKVDPGKVRTNAGR
jgi:hypothetical protein